MPRSGFPRVDLDASNLVIEISSKVRKSNWRNQRLMPRATYCSHPHGALQYCTMCIHERLYCIELRLIDGGVQDQK